MDLNTLLSSSSGSSAGPDDNDDAGLFCKKLAIIAGMLLPVLLGVCLVLYALFTGIQQIGRIKFSIEPVVYTGLDSAAAAVPPSFNLTLRAENTHYSRTTFCSSGPASVEVVYSGMTIAMADAEPFCVDARGEKIITATVSPGWPVLPAFLQERMDSDRRLRGGVQLEVGFVFSHSEDDGGRVAWVRCRTTLDQTQASPCNSYFIKSCLD